MTAIAAHLCRLYMTGTSSNATSGALNDLGGGTSWQIPKSGNRQILDPSTAQVFENGTSTVTPATIDHLFGIVNTPGAGEPALNIQDINYLPKYEVGTVTDFSISVSSDILDCSTIDGEVFRNYKNGLVDLSGSLTLLETPNQDYDTTLPASTDPLPGEIKLFDLLSDGTPKVLEIKFDPTSNQVFRAFIVIESYENTGSVDGLVETSISFQGAPQSATETGTSTGSAYSFGDIGS
ncbi:MAG: hypothetical protein GOVbin406_52 [Prokaryotic dsDNA virus sp.]|nr:MAG: hypothetical protein GOVbin406_52 [Prokaryotic dsDNA virus sp.]|tara:strand:- start:11653 stop:12360 length:708 start_codon:yes stop_codon:yes gene_type:complete